MSAISRRQRASHSASPFRSSLISGECPAIAVQDRLLAADLLPALHDNIDILGIELDAEPDCAAWPPNSVTRRQS
jgi:hypothetical protein